MTKIVTILDSNKSFIIYGAQVVAVGAYRAIAHLTGRKPECFAVGRTNGRVSYPTGNSTEIEGIPVRAIEEVAQDAFIVVAVTELIQREVLPWLSSHGYQNIFVLTQHEEHLLMSEYYRQLGRFPVATNYSPDFKKTPFADLVMYEVRNDRDKLLLSDHPLLPYEHTIQAGAALSDQRIAEFADLSGINISRKNRQYCEMTAVYWVWKNVRHDWIGIEHYRRHLLVTPQMMTDEVDAFLPLPYICYPDERAQFVRFSTPAVWDSLCQALQILHPSEFESYKHILYGPYQYTYNLLCARWEVFDDYCQWFFNITEYMEGMSGEVPELASTRALSYVSEVLTNLYFLSHEDSLRIRHVEKAIYV